MATPLRNPYVGPRPFQTGETLYGRDQELFELLDLLIAERIVLLYSPSGAGKTSLIQAGLLPRLVAENFQVLPVMRVSLEPPPEQKGDLPEGYNRYVLSALLSLEEGVPADRQLSLNALASMTLTEYVERRDLSPRPPFLKGEGEKNLTPRPPLLKGEGENNLPSRPLLLEGEGEQELPSPLKRGAGGEVSRTVFIFDQFEEILTIDPTDRAAKTEFFVQVGALLRNRDYYALFAMREEFPAGLDPYLRHLPTRLSTTFRLELLGVNAAQAAMQEPARQAGIPFTAAAAAKLINDLRTVQVQETDGSMQERPGLYVEPVQLQVVCHRLWNHLPAGIDAIQESHLQEAGDVSAALSGYYADSVAFAAQQTGARERGIREWFDKHLITEQGIRGQVLRGAEESQGLTNQAIAPLVDAHLVRAENRRGATWYELAHDRLIEPIRNDNAAWFEQHLSALQRQANLWQSQARSKGFLLSDEALTDAEQWALARQDDLTPVDQAFLMDCQEVRAIARREHKQALRIRWLAVVSTIIIGIIALIALGFARIQRNRAQDSEKQRTQSLFESYLTYASLLAKVDDYATATGRN